MLREQFDDFWQRSVGTERKQFLRVQAAATAPHAVVVSGLRRAGKSTLLAQLAHRLGADAFYYVNFDDDRLLGFQADDASALLLELAQTFGERRTILLDEVQNVTGWERFARRWMDQGYKLYITGSNAALLSRELGTRLTGRYIPIELFPFSFSEYLAWRGLEAAAPRTTLSRARRNRELDEYLQAGGVPEALQYPTLGLLRTIYDDILYRDIAARHQIEALRALRELSFQLISNPAGLVSFNKLKQQLGLGSVTTIKNYVQYLEDSWLIMTATVYDASVKRQLIAPKKVYGIDTGMIRQVGFHATPNTGHLLENLAFLHLRRSTRDIYYYTTRSGFEVDLFVPDRRLFIQVAQHLQSPEVFARETRALQQAVAEIPGTTGLLLSTDAVLRKHEPLAKIELRPLADWLLDE